MADNSPSQSSQTSSSNELMVFSNKSFDLPLPLLPKLKDNKHQLFTPPCQDLVNVLGQFSYFEDSNPKHKEELLKMAATRVNFKTFKTGEFISDSDSSDIYFILKGDVALFEERNEREIKQENYWRQQIEKIKRKLDATPTKDEKSKLEEEFFKAEKVLNFYYKEDQAQLLSRDLNRRQINFTINNECAFKQTQVIKSGVCVGPHTDHSDRNPFINKYQLVALSTTLILELNHDDQSEIFKKNNNLQVKVKNILSKYFQNVEAFDKEMLQKLVKGIQEICFSKNQLIYHENFDNSQNLYILVEGAVEITVKKLKQQVLLDTISCDEIFGIEFLASSRSLRQYTARSQTNLTTVLVISYDVMRQYFPTELMESCKTYGEMIHEKYQNLLTSHVQHIVSICKQKGMKIPLNYQNMQNTPNGNNGTSFQTTENNNTITLSKSNTSSRSPFKRSDARQLSKKHSAVIEESLLNLKRQQTLSMHGSNMSGYQSGSTNTSSLGNSGAENKISALYNQISNKAGSSSKTLLKSRQNSIDIDMNEIVPLRVHFQLGSHPVIPSNDYSNEKQQNTPSNWSSVGNHSHTQSQYPKSMNVLPSLPSPKSGSTPATKKLFENNQLQQNNQNNSSSYNLTQNQLLKRYLSSRYCKQQLAGEDSNLLSQNFEEETKKVEPIFRRSLTSLMKEQNANTQQISQTNQMSPETIIKFAVDEELSPIKKTRNLSVRESVSSCFGGEQLQQQQISQQQSSNQNSSYQQALYQIQQRRILKQFRVSEEVDKYINQDSNHHLSSVSCQQSPIKRIKGDRTSQILSNQNQIKINSLNSNRGQLFQSHKSLDKYIGVPIQRQIKSNASIGTLFALQNPPSKKPEQQSSPFSSNNLFNTKASNNFSSNTNGNSNNYYTSNYFCQSLTSL